MARSDRNLKFAIVVVALVALALYSATAASFFAWITADPPIGLPDGTTRAHSAGELANAQTMANAWALVFAGTVVATIATLVAWWRRRSGPVV